MAGIATLKNNVRLYLWDVDKEVTAADRVGHISQLGDVGGEAEDIDVTTIESMAREYVNGFDNNGNLDVTQNVTSNEYVAMDIKNAPGKYQETAGFMRERVIAESSGNVFPVKAVQQSVELLKNSGIPYEFRTTVVKEFHTLQDLQEICVWIAGSPAYYLQQFEDSGQLIAEMDASVEKGIMFHAYEEAEIKKIAESLNRIPGMEGKVHLRGLSGE